MNSYPALFVLINFAGGYICLNAGRRSWSAATLLLPASVVWFAIIFTRHWILLESPVWKTNPIALWIVGSSIVPLLGSITALLIQLRQRKFLAALRDGKCLHCGYDLRFVKRSACPECGNPV